MRGQLPPYMDPSERTHIVTAGGHARSGKGTSMAKIKIALEHVGQRVELIDQGIKFRAMAEVALSAGSPMDSPTELDGFIRSTRAREATLAVLSEVSEMDEKDKKARLYIPEVSKASGKIGEVPSAHEVAVGLLRAQVEDAVEAKTNIVLIDGRGIEKYAHQFTDEGIAKFVMGWFFKCDPAIAARRSLGLFGELEDLSQSDKMALLNETFNISDRNKSDSVRTVDPLREPKRAYHLDLATYGTEGWNVPYKMGHDILRTGSLMAVVDTSYTDSIEEMTGPVTELTKFALFHQGPLKHEDVGIKVIDHLPPAE